MKLPRTPHSWKLTPREAVAVQKELAARVSLTPPEKSPRFIAGLDAAFSPDDSQCIAGVVLWDRIAKRVVEQHTALKPLTFTYVPGLLSFREAPALLAALAKLEHPADALMCDGQGLAHPRRFGIACHLGVVTRLSSIGCAKSRLIGDHDDPGSARGSVAPLKIGAEQVGEVLRTRGGVKPIYLSIGHSMDLETARQIVLDCAFQFRLPEPTRLADRLVADTKRAMRPAAT